MTAAAVSAEPDIYLNNVTALSAGGWNHTCALLNDSTIKCWGSNEDGQLGNGTTTNSPTPTLVTGLTNVTEIASGSSHTCALLADSTVACWGSNFYGQLGNGTTSNSLTPVTVPGITNATAISAKGIHTCALLSDSTIKCWGYNYKGQLGDGMGGGTLNDPNFSTTPVSVSGISNATAISSGRFHNCALLNDASMKCWGENEFGQLGNGDSGYNKHSLTPDPVVGIANATDIAASDYHTCALLTDNTVKCWGNNEYDGQLGNGSATNSSTPVSVQNITNAIDIDSGGRITCAILNNNSTKCWGANYRGQLGNGSTVKFASTPVDVLNLGNVSSVSIGTAWSCAVQDDNTAKCWGDNYAGQLGDGTTQDSPVPVSILRFELNIAINEITGAPGSAFVVTGSQYPTNTDVNIILTWPYAFKTKIIQVTTDATGNFSFNLETDVDAPEGEYSVSPAFGSDSKVVELAATFTLDDAQPVRTIPANEGSNPTVQIPHEMPEPDVALANVATVAAGEDHSCALLTDQTIECWGSNDVGQLGTDSELDTNPIVLAPVSGIANATVITAGHEHSCALLDVGTIKCWGKNDAGQLGNGTSNDANKPVAIPTIDSATAVAAGEQHTCALLADGTVKCWGSNEVGQLGNDTTTSSRFPVLVDGVANATAISTGRNHSCALLADGSIYCWGSNYFGELGAITDCCFNVVYFESFAYSPYPVRVSGVFTATSIAAGDGHSCALVNDGTIKCWGDNSPHGALGDGSTIGSVTPETVVGISTATAITTGANHSCALLADQTMRCWGDNLSGQIGNGLSGIDSVTTTPTAVTGLVGVSAVSAGANHTCAILTDSTVKCWGTNSADQLNILPTDRFDWTPPSHIITPITMGERYTYGPYLFIEKEQDGSENNGGSTTPVQFKVSAIFKDVPAVSLSGALTLSGVSYSADVGVAPTSFVIPDGSLQTIVSIPVAEDALIEGTEALAAAIDGLSVGTVAQPSATANVLNDDGAYALSISRVQNGAEDDNGSPTDVKFVVALTPQNESGSPIMGDISYAGSTALDGDFGYVPTTFSIPDGGSAVTITVPIVEDVLIEGAETVKATISSADSAINVTTASATANIADDDSYEISALAVQNGVEGSSDIQVKVAVFPQNDTGTVITGTVTLSGTATSGADYAPLTNTTFSIADGASETIINMTVLDDGVAEDIETVEVAISNPNIGGIVTPLAVATIRDNDSGPRDTPLTNAIAVSAGNAYTCALIDGGSIQCWGANDEGQLGDGTMVDSAEPIQVANITNATKVKTGSTHSCAILDHGTVRCWGNNKFGQLGNGTFTNSLVPVQVAGITNAVAIAVGNRHTCAVLANGDIQCWGSRSGGRLGDGTGDLYWTGDMEVATPVFAWRLGNATDITTDGVKTCALFDGGLVRCWGFVENSNFFLSATSPTSVGLDNVAAITGDCALVESNSIVRCWAVDFDGVYSNSDTAVSNMTLASQGEGHLCAALADGALRCWGDNGFGELGNGSTAANDSPATVIGVNTATDVSAGSDHTCALLANSTVLCWGDNGSGQLGVSTLTLDRSMFPLLVGERPSMPSSVFLPVITR